MYIIYVHKLIVYIGLCVATHICINSCGKINCGLIVFLIMFIYIFVHLS
jgi:hypothetical protein